MTLIILYANARSLTKIGLLKIWEGIDMKALFNCSVIKNVYLRLGSFPIELEITYTDDPKLSWVSRKSIDSMCNREYHKEKYEKAYNTIKEALLNKESFVEIEI